jgi:hypothetical protein
MERAVLKYLLDTAPWINGLTMPRVLPRRIQILITADPAMCDVEFYPFKPSRLRK